MNVIKKKNIYVGVIVVLSFVLCLLNWQTGQNWGGDFSLYIYQAKSLVEGNVKELFLSQKFIIENTSMNFSPILYPWGTPVLLLPIYYFFGVDFAAFKILEMLFLVTSFYMVFQVFNNYGRIKFWQALLIIGILGSNTTLITYTNYIMAEYPFMFFSFLGLYFILKWLGNPDKKVWGMPVLITIILFFCFNIRSEGVGLYLALFVGQCQVLFGDEGSKIKKMLLPFAIPYVLSFILYIIVYKLLLPNGFSHHLSNTYWMKFSYETVINNFDLYFNSLKKDLFFLPVLPQFIYVTFGLIFVGIWKGFKDNMVITTFAVFVILVMIIWPYPNYRYLYPLYPFMLYFLIKGMGVADNLFLKKVKIPLFSSLILSVLLATHVTAISKRTLHYISIPGYPLPMHGPEISESKEMFAFVKNNVKEDEIVVFFKPRVMHLYTGRRSIALFPNIEEIREKADYYVENRRVDNYFQIPIENTTPGNYSFLEKVFSNEEFNIYKVAK